jgi:hypothetical protein
LSLFRLDGCLAVVMTFDMEDVFKRTGLLVVCLSLFRLDGCLAVVMTFEMEDDFKRTGLLVVSLGLESFLRDRSILDCHSVSLGSLVVDTSRDAGTRFWGLASKAADATECASIGETR